MGIKVAVFGLNAYFMSITLKKLEDLKEWDDEGTFWPKSSKCYQLIQYNSKNYYTKAIK